MLFEYFHLHRPDHSTSQLCSLLQAAQIIGPRKLFIPLQAIGIGDGRARSNLLARHYLLHRNLSLLARGGHWYSSSLTYQSRDVSRTECPADVDLDGCLQLLVESVSLDHLHKQQDLLIAIRWPLTSHA